MKDSEHKMQVRVFRWAKVMEQNYSELSLLFAIPNGGLRNKIVASKMKAEGVKSGVSDIFLSVARGGFHGLYIEMKMPKGKISDNQREFINKVKKQGYKAEICYSSDDAISIIEEYVCNRQKND